MRLFFVPLFHENKLQLSVFYAKINPDTARLHRVVFSINQNPVEAGLVFKPEEYVYSSAVEYVVEKGLLKDVVVAF